MEKLLVKSKCKRCKEEFLLTRWNVKKADSNDLTVIYFDCPKCNEKHFVQIDNSETRKIVAEMRFILVNKDKTKKNRYEELNNRLKEIRKQLIAEHDGILKVIIFGSKYTFKFFHIDGVNDG